LGRPLEDKKVKLGAPELGLTPGSTHKATVYSTYGDFKNGKGPIATGTITLVQGLFADWENVNMDGAGETEPWLEAKDVTNITYM
jgi:hypothetical protein